ncbi:Sucrose phosphorylase [Botrimarina colliarenosi]|uniref:Sucrose phosphorylase n=1 Tax=Botrimarina colliarenosi TaxID=2528001 RepID=A0A5C6A213_9BACT|nr:alpha-amylase family glycosyl hydrolase [Botrimarina colliarenosi]TWT93380.1 Sucrose phosphorylase [Botrimarina colliarenosi]
MSLADRVPSLTVRLRRVYGDQADNALRALEAEFADLLREPAPIDQPPTAPSAPRWDERDVVLITYADQLSTEGGEPSPLVTLREWLVEQGLDDLLSTVHLLPFCPYSSDDGFSVIDYLAVDPASGTWEDIAALGEPFELMFDLVLNHISQQSEWYAAYKRGEPPYDQFFIEADPALDYSLVTRPRSLPLLTPVETSRGPRYVWTTFSADQIDLNYGDPALLARMLRILVEYARRGARIVRFDAVAFLWKRLGTTCLHLPETHELVKLMRDVLAALTPRTLVLTETNVPHAENVSYFGEVSPTTGEADEAHMVYQFSLPPLLLEAFLSGDATALRDWLTDLAPPPPGCTFFNFTASHDGVGVRPLEGLVSEERLAAMVEAVKQRGAIVNTRRKPDGSDAPYELCVAYFSALAPETPDDDLHVRRFLSSQAVMLALRGMPAPYFQSLVGAPNDIAGAEASGIARRINRRKYERAELDGLLTPGTVQRRVFDGYRDLLAKRIAEPAFHPDAPQRVVDTGNPAVLAFERVSLDGERRLLVLCNVAATDELADLPDPYRDATDLLAGVTMEGGATSSLTPGQTLWLAPR